jgi:hypothetical protein
MASCRRAQDPPVRDLTAQERFVNARARLHVLDRELQIERDCVVTAERMQAHELQSRFAENVRALEEERATLETFVRQLRGIPAYSARSV